MKATMEVRRYGKRCIHKKMGTVSIDGDSYGGDDKKTISQAGFTPGDHLLVCIKHRQKARKDPGRRQRGHG